VYKNSFQILESTKFFSDENKKGHFAIYVALNRVWRTLIRDEWHLACLYLELGELYEKVITHSHIVIC
jgi:hypothetical protein